MLNPQAGAACGVTLGEEVFDQFKTYGLWPAQVEAALRAWESIVRLGGVLLCLGTGAGKTYVGCALAAVMLQQQQVSRAVAVVPARLKGMWRDVGRKFGLEGDALEVYSHRDASLQKLPEVQEGVFWLVDEAHVFRHVQTKAYRHLALSLRLGRVCLMTATPAQTSAGDVLALLKLLPWRGSGEATAGEILERVLVKGVGGVGEGEAVEVVGRCWRADPMPEHVWAQIEGASHVLRAHIKDEGLGALVMEVLQSRLESHPSAWHRTVKRLIRYTKHRGTADGLMLDRKAFKKIFGLDGPVQQWLPLEGFGGVLGRGVGEALERVLSPALVDALEGVGEGLLGVLDRGMRQALGEPSAVSGGGCLIFSQFGDTAAQVAKQLRCRGWSVGLVTGKGAKLGAVGCDAEVLVRAWMREPTYAQPSPQVLVCTDVLAVGHNLQRAKLLVHLELPWNPAMLLQRHGRVLRPGQRSERVELCLMLPPAPLERSWAERRRGRVLERLGLQARIEGGVWEGDLPRGALHGGLRERRAEVLGALMSAYLAVRYDPAASQWMARITRVRQVMWASAASAGQDLALAEGASLGVTLPKLLDGVEAALLLTKN